MALIATPGAADANSYVTLAEYNAYLLARLHVPAAASGATDAQKEAALIMATRTLDAMQCFTGAAATSTQALKWPRTGMVNKNGFPIADNVIPQELKDATSELAMQLAVSDITLDNDAAIQGLTKVKAGPVELGFKDSIDVRGLPSAVTNLLPSSWKCEDAGGPNDGTSFLFEVYNGS